MSSSEKSGSDAVVANIRCSPQRIAAVVRDFCPSKRLLVTQIGFKGMLKVPEINNLDKKFTLSLLDKINVRNRAIKLTDDTSIKMTPECVHRYLDIPNGPNKLFGLEDTSPSEKMDFIRFGIGSSTFDIDEKNSLKAAEEIVTASYPSGMSEIQAEQFKVSFVCFCMGNFLVAKYSSNHGIKDYWGSLMNASEIGTYNFCQAVVDEIIEAARHVQRELKANRTIKNVSGCHLYLQAMFLDNINLGSCNIQHVPLPRIQAFSSFVIQQMKTALRQNKDNVTTNKSAECSNNKINDIRFCIRDMPWNDPGTSAPIEVCQYVKSAAKHPSTEYLAAYTKGNDDKRLNEKQVGDLRLHNARIKLFINNFKKKTLSDLDSAGVANEASKILFAANVDKLMEDALDQVLFLSKNLHDHHSLAIPANCQETSCNEAGNTSDDTRMVLYQSSLASRAPTKKMKRRNHVTGNPEITGKNLIWDLCESDYPSCGQKQAPCTDQPGTSNFMDLTNCEGQTSNGDELKYQERTGYVTPQNKFIKSSMIQDIPDFTCIELADLGSPRLQVNTPLGNSNYRTPKPLIRIPAPTSVTTGPFSVDDPFDDIMEVSQSLDLNEIPFNNDISMTPIEKIMLKKGLMAKNPWFYGVKRQIGFPDSRDTLYNWLKDSKNSSLDSLWVKHMHPKLIKIHGNDFKSVYTRGFNFTTALFDLAVRRSGQTDLNMYGEGVRLRWMHPFESDFAKSVLDEEDYLNSRSVRGQLICNTEDYDISNCRMVAVPHMNETTWTAYLWDMKERVVHVIDPTFIEEKACEHHEFHGPIVDKLQGALQKSFATAYDGWAVDWSSWKKRYVLPFLPAKKSNESGILTLLAMRTFNGTKFEVPQTEAALKNFQKELLYDVLSVEGNSGAPPTVFVQTIE